MECGTKDLQRLPHGTVGRGLAVYRDSAVSAENVTCVGRREIYILMMAELAGDEHERPMWYGVEVKTRTFTFSARLLREPPYAGHLSALRLPLHVHPPS